MLHEKCILVSLKITMPPQSKLAKKATEDTEVRYQTARKQGKVIKQLFSKGDIEPLTKLMGKARKEFNTLSLPYDDAYRIIPSESYFNFTEAMSALSREFDTRKQTFLRDYEAVKNRSRAALGTLFREDDYLSVGELDARISFQMQSSIMPPSNAFDKLVGLDPEAIEELKIQAVEAEREKLKGAQDDLVERLFDALHKSKVKLKVEDAVFRDTLVSNIHAAVKAIDTLNLTGDENLSAIADEVRETLEGVTPDDLRKDKELRKATAEKAEETLQKMAEFF